MVTVLLSVTATAAAKRVPRWSLYKIGGGGHTEPSIKERYSGPFELQVGLQNNDIEMADEVWQFFKDKQKRH